MSLVKEWWYGEDNNNLLEHDDPGLDDGRIQRCTSMEEVWKTVFSDRWSDPTYTQMLVLHDGTVELIWLPEESMQVVKYPDKDTALVACALRGMDVSAAR